MWDVLVVGPEPEFGGSPDLSQGSKDVHIRHAAAVTPIEPFDEAVLHWLAGLDAAELDAVRISTFRQGDGDLFGPVVQTQLPGITAPRRDPVEHPDHSRRGRVQIDLDR